MHQFFQDRRQYCVPFYQRAYVWTLDEQWEQLWEDIREKAEARLSNQKPTPHFLGAVVLEPQPREGLIGVDVLHIIDGQQRLTTLQFVLASLLIVLKGLESTANINIVNGCMRNGNPETMRHQEMEVFKVWPTFRDRQNYMLAINAADLDELRGCFPEHFRQTGALRKIGIEHPPALAAIWYFTECFKSWIYLEPENANARAEILVNAVLKDMKCVSITLELEDDAQIIFETLNGRGAQLNATDLIRNYLFMRADDDKEDSESLYDTLWSPFESDYWSQPERRGRLNKPRMEWFVHTTLKAELHDDVDLGRLYFEYRRFATNGGSQLTAKKQLLTLTEYATHYKQLLSGAAETPIARFGRRISAYDITTLYPLALMISTSSLSDEDKTRMYNYLASYVIRRAVCNLTSKNFNSVFLSTLKQLQGDDISPDGLRRVLSGLTGEASRWPGDSEFRNTCLTAPLYYGRLGTPEIRSILTELEGHLRTTVRTEEPVLPDLSQLDVDHIMPRSWFAYWPLSDKNLTADESIATADEVSTVQQRQLVGENLNLKQQLIADRQASINTLGNLSLLNLGVNREAQHYAFANKRDLLIANTNLRLNIELIRLAAWDEPAIKARGEKLADAALVIWPGPQTQISS